MKVVSPILTWCRHHQAMRGPKGPYRLWVCGSVSMWLLGQKPVLENKYRLTVSTRPMKDSKRFTLGRRAFYFIYSCRLNSGQLFQATDAAFEIAFGESLPQRSEKTLRVYAKLAKVRTK